MMLDPPTTYPGPDARPDAAPEKPCGRRMRSQTGRIMWCIAPDGHPGDCHGVCPNEAHLVTEMQRPRWGR